MIRFGSVCSGIDAASMAWRPLGWKAAWFAEVGSFPSAVLAHHYPEVPNLGDMTLLPYKVLMGEIEAPELLVGGTPCQAFSVAGMREGLNDPRGQLTIKFVDLANAIDLVRCARGETPAIITWENVPGVLSDKGNAFGCFLGALSGEDSEVVPPGKKWADAGCVFGPSRTVAWRILDAQYFGLAQRRRRVFVVASARNDFHPAQVLFEFDGLRRDSAPCREAGQSAPTGTLGSTDGGSEIEHARAGHLLAFGGNNTEGAIAVSPALNANRGCHNPGDFEAGTLIAFPANLSGTQYVNTVGLSPCLGARNPTAVTTNAFQPDRAYSVALRGRTGGASAELGDDLAGCLRTSSGGSDKAFALTRRAVRRLQPREYERLQGFPDDYTLVPFNGRPAQDGPRYSALGNSMAVPVMAWIGQRIQTFKGGGNSAVLAATT